MLVSQCNHVIIAKMGLILHLFHYHHQPVMVI